METAPTGAAIHVGPAGWSYADWIGPVYPAGTRTDGLLTIARYFDCIELNSSFYRTPSQHLVRSWAERIADTSGFTFTVKVLQRFTHERAGTADEARRFIHSFDPLLARNAIGGFLLQFPWSFRDSPENRGLLADLGRWFKELPTAVELRHGSWNAPSTGTLLSECGLAFCNIDQPAVGASMPPTEIVTDRRLGVYPASRQEPQGLGAQRGRTRRTLRLSVPRRGDRGMETAGRADCREIRCALYHHEQSLSSPGARERLPDEIPSFARKTANARRARRDVSVAPKHRDRTARARGLFLGLQAKSRERYRARSLITMIPKTRTAA